MLLLCCAEQEQDDYNELPVTVLSHTPDHGYFSETQIKLPESIELSPGTNKGAISHAIFEHLFATLDAGEWNHSEWELDDSQRVACTEGMNDIILNHSLQQRFELSVRKGVLQPDKTFHLTHIRNTYSNLEYAGKRTIDGKVSHKYTAQLAFHFECCLDGKAGTREHLVYAVPRQNVIYSAIPLVSP